MDTSALLEQLLDSGRAYAEQGQKWVEEKAGIPEQSDERQATLEAMGKGALGAGVLALLLGTGAGRRLTGSALKLGSLAALGGLAYKSFQSWHGVHSTKAVEEGIPVDKLADNSIEIRSQTLLKAIIAAAKADGHIDQDELAKIKQKIESLGLDSKAAEFIQAELTKPLNVANVAAGADSPTAAAEIYLVSLILIDDKNAQERSYLNQLATQLGLNESLVRDLEKKVGTSE